MVSPQGPPWAQNFGARNFKHTLDKIVYFIRLVLLRIENGAKIIIITDINN